jgi:hypothetical protein
MKPFQPLILPMNTDVFVELPICAILRHLRFKEAFKNGARTSRPSKPWRSRFLSATSSKQKRDSFRNGGSPFSGARDKALEGGGE